MSDTKDHFDAKRPDPSWDNDEEIVESDIELDATDVVEPDNDPPQKVRDRERWSHAIEA